ncbi:cytochrome P450 [Thermostaphylospora chromogena]|mgnify:CR=1 FL=1|uniref:Pentalenolactone synthase n=1 Tax=Thermostaphylospora chromogena TaxID=35622 RepID=A0A1H1H4F2_9ACTN|nr:cytochrome P450 [Thermostaphylospora chromogena]SDR20382.1 pentalenolactone synthase [Thermostaphylospora chromogena]
MTVAAARMPFPQPHPLHPPPLLRKLQARGPIHPIRTATGDPAWLVTDYELARQLLADDRMGRSHPDPERASRTGHSVLFGGPSGVFDTEPADHARMRALLRPHFSPRRMRALRGRVETLTAGLLDDMAAAGPPADLHAALALPLPIAVICELLGVPYEDRAGFRAWTQAAADVTDRARSERGLAELFDYGRRLVARKRAQGHVGDEEGADVISRLAATDGVGDEEAARLGMLLLFAGHETTVAAIGLGALALLAHPDQWRMLTDDPSRVDAAVEELLRTPGLGGGGIPRYARTDLDVGGVRVRTGDLVVMDLGAANHDPAAFPDPDRFDITRPPSAHLTFGHGARYCLGAPLARIELQVVFTQLAVRFPTLRLACRPQELTVTADVLVRGLTALPVTW